MATNVVNVPIPPAILIGALKRASIVLQAVDERVEEYRERRIERARASEQTTPDEVTREDVEEVMREVMTAAALLDATLMEFGAPEGVRRDLVVSAAQRGWRLRKGEASGCALLPRASRTARAARTVNERSQSRESANHAEGGG